MDQQILNAVFIGSIYAMFAVGYTLVFGVLDILNLAHSAVFMLGAAVTYSLVVNHGQAFWIACILGIAVSAVLGFWIEGVFPQPLPRPKTPPNPPFLSTNPPPPSPLPPICPAQPPPPFSLARSCRPHA